MNPNEACALALRVAAGQGKRPQRVTACHQHVAGGDERTHACFVMLLLLLLMVVVMMMMMMMMLAFQKFVRLLLISAPCPCCVPAHCRSVHASAAVRGAGGAPRCAAERRLLG
jgi:hypothetical protein